ncbi:MAG: integrase family protein [Anaerocolumna sp.]|nr:integrase family protein [Anaerocolumna sp.]
MNKNELQKSLDEFLLDLKYEEKAINTLIRYKCNIQAFIDYLSEDELINKDHVLAFKKHLINNNFKTSTINNYIVTVNKFLKWIDLQEFAVKQLKKQRKYSLNEMLSIVDYKRLLRAAKNNNRMDMYYIMKILAMTGIRISELQFFTVENIKSNFIRVNNKGKERTVPVRQDLSRELRKYCRDNRIREGYIFKGQVKGKMPNKSTIWRNLQKLAGRARVKKTVVHAHSFRHLFAKLFLTEFGGDITELADIMGHNSLETTRIYTRSTDREKLKKMENIKY